VEVLGSKRTDEKYDAFWNIDMIYLFMQANDCPARTALELALTAKDLSPDDINLRNLFNELKGASLGFGINFDTLKNQYLRTATFKDLPNAADLATQAAIMVLAELTTLTQAIKSGGDQAVMEARAEMAFKRIKKWRFHGVLQGIVANGLGTTLSSTVSLVNSYVQASGIKPTSTTTTTTTFKTVLMRFRWRRKGTRRSLSGSRRRLKKPREKTSGCC